MQTIGKSGCYYKGHYRTFAFAILWACWSLLLSSASTLSYAQSTTEETAPSDDAQTIELATSPSDDKAILSRLIGIYSELDDLDNIDVTVRNGVVNLQGELLTNKSIVQAVELAGQVDGVVEVVNEIALERDVTVRLDKSLDQLSSSSRSFISTLPTALLALTIVIGSWFVGRFLAKRQFLFKKITPNAFIAELVGNVVWLIVLALGVFIALTLLDATEIIGTVLGAAGILGLALGFAVRDTVENYIASILLSLRNPFKARDYVSIDSHEGSVARLTSRATILISADGNHIRIPNATVYKSIIVNYTRNPRRRFTFVVGIDTGDDIVQAQELALSTLSAVPGVLSDPSPTVTVEELGDSNTTLKAMGWLDQRKNNLVKVRSESIRLTKEAFDQEGIVMPEPIYRVLLDRKSNLSGLKPSGKTETTGSDSLTIKDGAALRRPDVHLTKPAQDTSVDNSIADAIQSEIERDGTDNLLSENGAHE